MCDSRRRVAAHVLRPCSSVASMTISRLAETNGQAKVLPLSTEITEITEPSERHPISVASVISVFDPLALSVRSRSLRPCEKSVSLGECGR